MSRQWNPSNPNFHFGNEHSRPYVSSPMVLACRICDEMFLSSLALVQHYQFHQNQFAQRAQNNQTAPFISSLRESRERNFTNNPFQPRLSPPSTLQQRYHPFYPNVFRTLQQEGTPIASNPFLAPAQTQNSLQPRHPVPNHNTLAVSLSFPNSISGKTVAGGSQIVIRQRLSSAQRDPPPEQVSFPNIQGENQHDQLADKGTVWYLSQLEKPIPIMIDLEKEDETCEYLKLDLALKL